MINIVRYSLLIVAILSISGCRLVEESAPFVPYKAEVYTADNILSPALGEIYYIGDTIDIKWTGVKSPTVRIDLWKKKIYNHQVIRTDCPNSGSYRWQIPGDTPGSTTYQIKITSERDTTYFVYSSDFVIRRL